MKDTIQIILILISSFALSFLISGLLDLDWISREWSRSLLVILLMLIVLIVGATILWIKVKKLKKSRS